MLDVNVVLKRGSFALRAELYDAGFICLSGLNGSGKSTVLNIMAGKLKPEEGHVRVDATDITSYPPEKRELVLVNPDSFLPHMDVEKHLRWGARVKKLCIDESEVRSLKGLLGIDSSGRVDEMSLGMRERVSLATALLSRPKVLLVDEAFSNIDHRDDFIRTFSGLCRNRRMDVVSTTQQKSDAMFADHHYDMVGGISSKVF